MLLLVLRNLNLQRHAIYQAMFQDFVCIIHYVYFPLNLVAMRWLLLFDALNFGNLCYLNERHTLLILFYIGI